MTMGMSFPAWMIPVVSRPPGIGRVFYVNEVTGDDNNNGIDPNTPFLTIAYALTQCASQRNDYIIVLDANPWALATENTPIAVNKKRVHIIGMSCESVPICTLTSSQDSAIFGLDGGDADHVEIAGFDLGGGDSHAGIEPIAGTVDLVYIHHCNFGSEYCKDDDPLYGVWLPIGLGAKAWRIEKCKFFGATDAGGGKITADGVYIFEGLKHEVKECVFMGLPGIAINGNDSRATIIRSNEIITDADTQGAAITLGVNSQRCLVSYNKAAFGEAKAALANPYLDNAGVDANAWVANYWSETLTAPA